MRVNAGDLQTHLNEYPVFFGSTFLLQKTQHGCRRLCRAGRAADANGAQLLRCLFRGERVKSRRCEARGRPLRRGQFRERKECYVHTVWFNALVRASVLRAGHTRRPKTQLLISGSGLDRGWGRLAGRYALLPLSFVAFAVPPTHPLIHSSTTPISLLHLLPSSPPLFFPPSPPPTSSGRRPRGSGRRSYTMRMAPSPSIRGRRSPWPTRGCRRRGTCTTRTSPGT